MWRWLLKAALERPSFNTINNQINQMSCWNNTTTNYPIIIINPLLTGDLFETEWTNSTFTVNGSDQIWYQCGTIRQGNLTSRTISQSGCLSAIVIMLGVHMSHHSRRHWNVQFRSLSSQQKHAVSDECTIVFINNPLRGFSSKHVRYAWWSQ